MVGATKSTACVVLFRHGHAGFGCQMKNKLDDAALSAAKDDLLRLCTDCMAEKLKSISGYGQMLERHLSIQHDDIGSDYALAIRESIEELKTFLTIVRPVAVRDEVALEDVNEVLDALRRPASPKRRRRI